MYHSQLQYQENLNEFVLQGHEDQYRNKFFMGDTVRTKWQFLFYCFVVASADKLGRILF